MTKYFPSLLAEWRDANQRAFDAERALFEAQMQYVSGRGPIPGPAQVQQTMLARAEATRLFEEVMGAGASPDDRDHRPAGPDQHAQH